MTSLRMLVPTVLLALATVAAAHPAAAQVVASVRWQTQPFCNVVTLNIVQQGAVYQLVGQDDVCGAGAMPVTGTALLQGSQVVLGFDISTPSGTPTHITATVALATAGGTWADSEGNRGTFAPNPAGGGTNPPRPARSSGILTAMVGSGGTLLRGIGAVSATRAGSVYVVTFNRDVTACTVSASVVDATSNAFPVGYVSAIVSSAEPRVVRTAAFNSIGLLNTFPVSVVVICP